MPAAKILSGGALLMIPLQGKAVDEIRVSGSKTRSRVFELDALPSLGDRSSKSPFVPLCQRGLGNLNAES